jgi:hypothetical protein
VGGWVVAVWLRLAAEYSPGRIAQACVPITGPEGWLKYLSKHASRGVAHYQRQGKPAGWEGTGRLWGKSGGDSWPVVEPVAGVLDDQAFRRLRRMVRGYVVAEARAWALQQAPGSRQHREAWGRVAWARRMLRCNDRGLSAVRGMSEWVPGSVLLEMAACAGWDGELRIQEVAA